MYRKIPPYKPLKSRCVFPGDEEAPQGYIYNCTGKLGKIQIELDWKMFDFCRLQQITHSHISKNEQEMDELCERYKDEMRNATDETMGLVRFRENINAQSSSNYQTYQFANQMTVVGLWAIAEQTMGFVYKQMAADINGIPESDVSIPYHFDEFKKKFSQLGISLESLDTFDDANECRTLNNRIKHGHTIEGHILSFSYFQPLSGKLILEVDFELQRYVTGVIQFLSSLIEEGNRILDPAHPKN
ncbi:hypothetical protein [Litoribrevibacter albus]|uniref:Uncharacterized protein n=1 Tax=Litoribrevibacter albus TaxID=1473156 RepID=A0AA37W736_9GAMM|nr:hypothetical protein [Litoribrevibacter albus]GLQ30221.1 hypothetical protein GCM10007876_06990 [Litoribrevibacter albus]